MLYENMTQEQITRMLGYAQPFRGNFKRVVERQQKYGKTITETGRIDGKKVYSIELPEQLYEIPKDFILIKDNMTLEEASEYLHYTYQSMKSSWDTLQQRQLENFDRAVIKYYDLLNKTKIAIAEKPSPKNQNLENEIWEKIKDDNYEVSNLGRVRNLLTKEILTGHQNSQGYITVTKKQRLIHRLVLSTFDPREDSNNLFVDHINGKRNDNRLENLRWVSPTKNNYYRDENFTPIGELLAQKIIECGYEKVFNALLELN